MSHTHNSLSFTSQRLIFLMLQLAQHVFWMLHLALRGEEKGKKKIQPFTHISFFFSSSFRRETIWKANLGSLWWFNLTTNWFLSSFFQIVVGHQWMPRQLLACLIPRIKGHCGSKTETNGFFILHLSALQSKGTGSPPCVFLFRCILSPFNKVLLFLKEREWMGGGRRNPTPFS